VLWTPASMLGIIVNGHGTCSMTAHFLETDLLLVHMVINEESQVRMPDIVDLQRITCDD
jgi:hypothetical protein